MKCTACDLHTVRRKIVKGVGNPDGDILVLCEAPEAVEDATGRGFISKPAQILFSLFTEAGFDLNRIYFEYMVSCVAKDFKSGETREPSAQEILACAPHIALSSQNKTLVFFCGSVVTKYYKKQFKNHFKITNLQYLLSQGWKSSDDYWTMVNKLKEVLHEVSK